MSEVIYEGRRIRVLFLSSFFQSPWVPEKWIFPFSLLFSSMTCFFKTSGFSQTWTSPLQVVRSQSRSQYPTPWPMMSASEARQKGHSLNIINIITTSLFNLIGSNKRARVSIDHGPRKIAFASATRLSRIFGTRACTPQCSWHTGTPTYLFRFGTQAWLSPLPIWGKGPSPNFGGEASHDYSWFGLIDNLFYETFS